MADEEKSNIVLIKGFFMPGERTATIMGELKALTEEDKNQLGGGIRNGSFTY